MKIQYGLMQATAEQIADKLALVGVKLGGKLKEKEKLAVIAYYQSLVQ